MQFGIQIDGRFLDLDERYGITLTLINPAYDQDSADRKYSYGSRMMPTPKTKEILRHADRLDVQGKPGYESTLIIEGVPFDTGLIVLDVVTESTIGFHYKSESIDLIQRMKDQKPIGKTVQDGEIHRNLDKILLPYTEEAIKRYFLFNNNAGTYSIYINGEKFSYTTASTFDEINIITNLTALINATYPGFATNDGANIEFTTFDLDVEIRVDQGSGFFPDNTLKTFAQHAQETLVAHMDELRESPDPRYAFPLIKARAFYSDKAVDFHGFINFMISTISGPAYPENRHYDIDEEFAHIKNTIVPFLRVKYLIEKGLNLLGVTIKNEEVWQIENLNRLLLFTTQTMDWIRTDEFFVESSPDNLLQKINGFKTTIDLNNHIDQEISLDDLFQAFLGYFGLYFVLTKNRMSIRKKVDQVRSRSIDWTSLAESDFENRKQHDQGFIMSMLTDSEDDPARTEKIPDIPFLNLDFLSGPSFSQLDPIVSDPGKKIINLPAKTLVSELVEGVYTFDNIDFTWVLNLALRTCRSFHQATSKDLDMVGKHAMTFFYENGNRESENPTWPNQFYLQSSNDDIVDGEVEVSDHSLLLPGERGIYEEWHREFPADDTHNVITKKIRLRINDLLKIRTWKNPRRTIYHEKGQIDCLIKSVQIRITPVGMEPSIVEFVKIN